jgi:hypothetical protein
MKHRLAVCIPYRDNGDGVRKEHLDTLVPYLTKFLDERDIDHKIFVGHQCDDKLFNRSAMKNIPFIEACKEGGFDYFAFHDVDMLPEDGVDYSYPEKHPIHIFTYLSQWGYKLRDSEYFGGCVLFTKEQFEKVNGYNPDYWDWGMEDDDLFWRCYLNKMANASYIDGPGETSTLKFNGETDFIEVPSTRLLRNLTNRDFVWEALVKPYRLTDKELYLIGDTNRKWREFPIICRPGWNLAINYNNSQSFSASVWNWRNDLSYCWIKRYSNLWSWIKLDVNDSKKEIRLFLNNKEAEARHGEGTKSPLNYSDALKRYGGMPYFIGCDNPRKSRNTDGKYFRGEIAEIKMKNYRGNVILHYDFETIEDGKVLDISGNDNHGILHGFKSNPQKESIEKISNSILPHRRYGKVECLDHEDLGIVEGKFKRGETTAKNERLYRLKMQKGELNIQEHGLNSTKYKLLNKETIYDKHVMLNVML